MGKVEASLTKGSAQGSHSRACDRSLFNLGVLRMSLFRTAIAAAAISFAAFASAGAVKAADLPVKAKAKPVADLPFFLLIDDRVTFSYILTGTDPGVWTRRPDGSING